MPSGLIALLDDVAMIAKLASASVDDIAGATAKAGAKAAGVVIDDTAVTPRYVTGLLPERELPIIWKIALGSLRNKLLFLVPGAIALAAFAPFLITPLLMIGGAYLAFEATEKILEIVLHDHHHQVELLQADTPQELEDRQVQGAIRTDFILSAEIVAIALNSLGDLTLWEKGAALIVRQHCHHRWRLWRGRPDREAGRHRPAHGRTAQSLSPGIRSRTGPCRSEAAVGPVGDRHCGHAVGWRRHIAARHGRARRAHHSAQGPRPGPSASTQPSAAARSAPILEWVANAVGAAIAGAIIGWVIAMIVRRFHKHPEELIVD